MQKVISTEIHTNISLYACAQL